MLDYYVRGVRVGPVGARRRGRARAADCLRERGEPAARARRRPRARARRARGARRDTRTARRPDVRRERPARAHRQRRGTRARVGDPPARRRQSAGRVAAARDDSSGRPDAHLRARACGVDADHLRPDADAARVARESRGDHSAGRDARARPRSARAPARRSSSSRSRSPSCSSPARRCSCAASRRSCASRLVSKASTRSSCRISLPESRYGDDERRMAFFQQLLERVGAVPGVERAAGDATRAVCQRLRVDADDSRQDARGTNGAPEREFLRRQPGHLPGDGHPALARPRDPADRRSGQPDGVRHLEDARRPVLSERGSDRQAPADLAGLPRSDELSEIVGVVGDVKQWALDMDAPLQVYQAARQHPYFGTMTLIVRSSARARAADVVATGRRARDRPGRACRQRANARIASRRVGWRPPVYDDAPDGHSRSSRCCLSAIGVYGLVAFSVGQRTQEIGIRVALGSSPGQVMRLVFRQGLGLTAVGAAVGIVARPLRGAPARLAAVSTRHSAIRWRSPSRRSCCWRPRRSRVTCPPRR